MAMKPSGIRVCAFALFLYGGLQENPVIKSVHKQRFYDLIKRKVLDNGIIININQSTLQTL